jgi:hypothetical protein
MDGTNVTEAALSHNPVNFFVIGNDVIVSRFPDRGDNNFYDFIGIIFKLFPQKNPVNFPGIETTGLAFKLPEIELVDYQLHGSSAARKW